MAPIIIRVGDAARVAISGTRLDVVEALSAAAATSLIIADAPALSRKLSQTCSQRKAAQNTRRLKRGTKRSPSKKASKKKMNPYMKKMNKARKSGAPHFIHEGKKYVRKEMKTVMVTYARA